MLYALMGYLHAAFERGGPADWSTPPKRLEDLRALSRRSSRDGKRAGTKIASGR